MICHGNSDPTAICVAIKDAVHAAESGMNAMMGERLGTVASAFSPTAA
jgi:fatty acid/phospholipid biosynthesis enzyme